MSIPDPVTTGLVTAGALQVAKQAQDFIAAASGHPGESIATILGSIAKRRLKNAESITSKSHLILLDIGQKPGEIPLNILQPALEAASLQEESCLQDTWANLLANAADPRKKAPVLPIFTSTLKDLGPREVKFLDAFIDHACESMSGMVHGDIERVQFSLRDLQDVYGEAGLTRVSPFTKIDTDETWQAHRVELQADDNDFSLLLQLLLKNRILEEQVSLPEARSAPSDPLVASQLAKTFSITYFGAMFLKACRSPTAPPLIFSRGCMVEDRES